MELAEEVRLAELLTARGEMVEGLVDCVDDAELELLSSDAEL